MKFSEEQIELLWASAEHWLENWKDPSNAKYTGDDCPCCQVYCLQYFREDLCTGCPIYQYTGLPICRDTPYMQALIYLSQAKYYPKEEVKAACEAEYRFLVSLALGEEP